MKHIAYQITGFKMQWKIKIFFKTPLIAMWINVHRGTHEIGGSCVEIWTENTRIIVDIGMQLVNPDGSPFDSREVHSKPVSELVKDKTLPDIKGLYAKDKNPVDAVLISHAHLDHYGLGEFINPEIPFYCGDSTHKLIELTRLYVKQGLTIQNPTYIEHRKTFHIGDIKITPYLNDHSAIDAYGFLIEGDEKRIYYTGDFRAHGYKKKLHNWFKNDPPQNVDYLLMEGTNIGVTDKKYSDESEIMQELKDVIEEDKFTVIQVSGQNIDRLVALYKAARSTNKTLIIDIYVAHVLDTLSKNHPSLPHVSKNFKNLRVYFFKNHADKLAEVDRNKLFHLNKYKIKPQEIDQNPNNFIMIVRTWMDVVLKHMKNIDGGNYIYSMWKGYLDQEANKNFTKYLEGRGFDFHHIHTSGHADVKTLKELADAINPKFIIPIHTFSRDKYAGIFTQPIKLINDGEIVKV